MSSVHKSKELNRICIEERPFFTDTPLFLLCGFTDDPGECLSNSSLKALYWSLLFNLE